MKEDLQDGTKTFEQADAARTPINAVYGVGYGALAVAGGLGVALVVSR